MNQLMNIDQINDAYLELWDQFATDTRPTLQPMQYAQPSPGAVVFVGINPSFSDSGWNRILRGRIPAALNVNVIFGWPNPHFNRQQAIYLESLALAHYGYFKPMRDFSAAIHKDWLNIDLFAWRERSQEKAKALLLDASSTRDPSSFCNRQLDLFDALIELAKPSAVVVVNALASSIYFRRRGVCFNQAEGYYDDRTKEGHYFPVHFSGMLTGGRALDVPSRDRLFWSVARSVGATWTPEFATSK